MIAESRSMLIVGIALAVPVTGHACSRSGFPALRSAGRAHFIAAPTADTVFAAAGSVRYVVGPGHSGPAVDRTIFGQVFSVERIGGLASRALRQPVQRAVLVPWDYGADCTPTPWTKSAAWAEPGSRGLFTAVLRDSTHWAGGVPTFDVFMPEFEPYPQQIRRQVRRSLPSDSIVPMEELFDLIELFPDQRLLRDSAEAGTEPLFAWARANPTLTRRYPIADALRQARFMVAMQRLRAIESPLTGTYRMSVSLSGGPARTFYARTHPVPITEWNLDNTLQRRVDDPTIVPRPDGYTLMAAVAQSLAALPKSCKDRDMRREAYMAVVHAPTDSTPTARRWTGKLEVSLAQRAFLGDTALGQFERAAFATYSRRSRARLPAEALATFQQSADGTIVVEQTLTLEDGQSLVLTGIRVSPDVVPCRW
jgi:hypothetical protein